LTAQLTIENSTNKIQMTIPTSSRASISSGSLSNITASRKESGHSPREQSIEYSTRRGRSPWSVEI